MGEQPLGLFPGIRNLKIWMKENSMETLWDISSWEDEGDCVWKDWNLGSIPMGIKEEADLLLHLL